MPTMRDSGKSPPSGGTSFSSSDEPSARAPAGPGDGRLRTVPRQQRARAAVQRILAATAVLLDEAGFDTLTTTAVAERADVNIATLYRYFPDKFSLVEALVLDQETDRAERLRAALQAFVQSADWRADLRAFLDTAIDLRLKTPGAAGLRRALHSSAQLWTVQRAGTARNIDGFAKALRGRVPSLGARRAYCAATATVVMLVGMLDWATADPSQRRTVLREGSAALNGYLAGYLD
jgi:AcrR family transcriptional regulator